MVHRLPLAAGVVIRPPVPVAGIVICPSSEPVPKRPVRVRGRVALERAPIRGASEPDRTARHPFAHPQRVLEVIDGGAAPARAWKSPSVNSLSAAFSSPASASRRFSVASSTLRPPNRLRHRWSVCSDTPSSRRTAATSCPRSRRQDDADNDRAYETGLARPNRGVVRSSAGRMLRAWRGPPTPSVWQVPPGSPVRGDLYRAGGATQRFRS